MNEIAEIVSKNGFQINHSKTRISYRDSKQTVTGLIVNKKINVDNSFYKQTRAMADCLYRKGSFLIDGKKGTIS